ncbi:hypothetical protein Q5H92_22220 [Hymenobacter sp. M29]|uniref:Uncharacterized protein n=1 Tax=Hymenobacter mellowenesis TaxID=3063995 RepID=A0ABT9AJ08_9BACT|nr:hypothetical protein [Hymenobacter sp. M29]MDO7849095.1 hypothetical protein [Hymenobacter sp. M29]
MTRFRRFLQWLGPRMPYVNVGLAGAAYGANQYVAQVFCQPVPWAAAVLIGSVGAFLAWPWLVGWPRAVRYAALFLQGTLVPVCVYCVVFMSPGALVVGVLFFFFLLPVLAWVPVVFAGQALRRAWRSELPGGRVVFGLGMVPLLVAQGWAEQQYRAVEAAVAQLPPAQRRQPAALVRVVPRTYMAERLAGTLFKYHNYEESTLNGWRPPLHDPLVNVSLWSRGGMGHDRNYGRNNVRAANPLLVYYWDADNGVQTGSLESQVALYHALFPALPIKADCTCNHTYDGESYLEWRPWLNSRAADAALRMKRKALLKPNNPLGL